VHHELILILDFGSQYTQLIARRVREQGVYCEIHPFHLSADEIAAKRPKGVILSGGPSSVTDEDAPRVAQDFYDKVNAPILGICYGMQMIAIDLGGKNEPAARREYGHAKLKVLSGGTKLFNELPFELDVWMSHGDHVTQVPDGFRKTATTGDVITAFENDERGIYCVQFHPEVSHTRSAKKYCETFCSMSADAAATGHRLVLSKMRSRLFEMSSARRITSSADYRAASIRRSRRRWCTKRSAIGRHASL
jgi:GMP synthase (glutamine-hydrolysing)